MSVMSARASSVAKASRPIVEKRRRRKPSPASLMCSNSEKSNANACRSKLPRFSGTRRSYAGSDNVDGIFTRIGHDQELLGHGERQEKIDQRIIAFRRGHKQSRPEYRKRCLVDQEVCQVDSILFPAGSQAFKQLDDQNFRVAAIRLLRIVRPDVAPIFTQTHIFPGDCKIVLTPLSRIGCSRVT